MSGKFKVHGKDCCRRIEVWVKIRLVVNLKKNTKQTNAHTQTKSLTQVDKKRCVFSPEKPPSLLSETIENISHIL